MSAHIEIYEAPGFLDDCLREDGVKFQSAVSESFDNVDDVAGDYATMEVTEGGAVNGCGYRKDISGLGLDTDEHPLIRVRLRGRGTVPQYKVDVEYTDASASSSGWISTTGGFQVEMMQLTAGKTVRYVKLYARSNQANGTAYIDYDYASILANPPLVPLEVQELVADLVTTVSVSGLRLKMAHDPLLGVTSRRYPLDENMGTIAYDLSTERYQSPHSASWASGRHGSCLYFNAASTNKLDTGYTTTLSQSLSIAFWVKAAPGAAGVIAGIGMTDVNWRRIQFNWTGNKIRLYTRDDATNVLQYTTDATVADNAWHLVVGIVDPGNDVIRLYVDGELDGSASGTLGTITLTDNDLTFGCLHNSGGYSSYTTCYIDEIMVCGRELTAKEVKDAYTRDPLSGAARAGAGNIVMAYVAAESESLDSKLITARVIDRVTYGGPDNHVLELICEDLGEVLHERTFSGEYAGATQISSIIGDIADETGFDAGIDTTNRSIVNKFNQEGAWSLLEKLAETAAFSTGETGANLYVDAGGALRFKKYGAFPCSHDITDGSDGGTPNILDIRVMESIKGSLRLANDIRVIVFEEENIPADLDAFTESAEGWSSPDPTDVGYPQSDTGDKYAGTASIHFNTTNPGTTYRMRLNSGDIDLTGLDRITFRLKHGAGLSINDFSVRLWRNNAWGTDYFEKTGVTKGASASWVEYSLDIADFSKTGNPGPIIDTVQVQANHSAQIGVGGFLIDQLRLVRNEKAGEAEDIPSQGEHGKRTLRNVDKSVTDLGYAGYLAENILAHRKNPLVTSRVMVQGRGQPGYRPPMTVELTSLKDGVDGETFQITRATHRLSPSGGYECELQLVASRDSAGSYEAAVSPSIDDVGVNLAVMRRKQKEGAMNSLRGRWV